MFQCLKKYGGVVLLFLASLACTTKSITPIPTSEQGNKIETTEVRESRPTRSLGDGARLWTGGKVYYAFENGFPAKYRKMIELAMTAVAKGTCIRFLPKGKKNSNYVTYRLLTPSGEKECSSRVGMTGGAQNITLSINKCDSVEGNYAGSAAHELMHALGFKHEFQRSDRDNFVKHIGMTENTRNYGKQPGKKFGIPFNFDSILQYDPKRRFIPVKKKQRPASVGPPLGSFKNMGQECRISAGDRNLIDSAYRRQCRLRNPPKHKNYIKIKGTDCNMKLQAMSDEV